MSLALGLSSGASAAALCAALLLGLALLEPGAAWGLAGGASLLLLEGHFIS